jgi:Flp pilus assembly protein TadG
MTPAQIDPRRSPSRRDCGSTALTTVLLTPVFIVVALMAFQAAMWSHARTEARAVARDAAALVARNGADPDASARAATEVLRTDTDLGDPAVDVVVSAGLVTATVTGRAPGLLRGTSAAVSVTEAIPVEGFRG